MDGAQQLTYHPVRKQFGKGKHEVMSEQQYPLVDGKGKTINYSDKLLHENIEL